MRAKSLALLVLALGCGLVASIGITQVMAKRHADPGTPVGETEPVLVAAVSIPPNEPLTAQMLRLEEWPKGKVPPGAASQIADVEKRRTRTRIYPGEAILKGKLLGKGAADTGASPQIPKGMRVVSVKVDAVSGTSSLIMPGDRVDVLVHLLPNPTAGINEPMTRTVLQRIKVFAIDSVIDLERIDAENKAMQAKTISLLVTPEQAQKIMLATELGQVRLVLRSPEDDQDSTVNPVSVSGLFGQERARDAVEPPPSDDKPVVGTDFLDMLRGTMQGKAKPADTKDVASAPVNANRYVTRLLTGGKMSEVILEPADDVQGRTRWRQTIQEIGAVDTPAPPALPATATGSDSPPVESK